LDPKELKVRGFPHKTVLLNEHHTNIPHKERNLLQNVAKKASVPARDRNNRVLTQPHVCPMRSEAGDMHKPPR